ncbi:MAG: argininosuccinate lyase [OCS116 cluster bacterium]|uniref:Argininosuccinate lyase n=1 Tax=OCS116 cluster bacterium TaxID=2030921 RepID=A0A2A4Z3X7_9PROT|nr:argininosuccinate lyase [OCS116 cluster bacterium]
MSDKKAANQMWGGRFADAPDALMEKINASIGYDQRFYTQDIAGSKAHAKMLEKCGIITADDAAKIDQGLDTISREIAAGEFDFKPALEDIHMNIEARLKEVIGEAAGRLHTGRSRNDQVALDFKLYIRDRVDGLIEQISALMEVTAKKAELYADYVMPGFTHLQVAQPVTFGHHLLAYVEMWARDKSRFEDARKRMNVSPLGAAALAGTSFPIDRHMTAEALGFDGPAANSLDAVADRDFVMETLAAASITAIHLSRLAEEMVIWSTSQFSFIKMSDRFSTGSSIMPQKRNPDAAELIRGKPGRIIGALTAIMIVMKGLPMTYAKDMQEDKEMTFDALDNLELSLAAMGGMIDDITALRDNMEAAAASGFSTATDLADWCVRVLNMPFRDAHHVTGSIVAIAEKKDLRIDELTLAEMQTVEPRITDEIFDVLSVQNSVKSRTSFGGTAPELVKKSAQAWLAALK